jgi:hypothetical protein
MRALLVLVGILGVTQVSFAQDLTGVWRANDGGPMRNGRWTFKVVARFCFHPHESLTHTPRMMTSLMTRFPHRPACRIRYNPQSEPG